MENIISQELEQIRIAAGGVLRCEDVIEYARDENTALHSRFTWDDTEAARQHRLWQARQVIKVAVVVLPQDNKSVMAYVSLVADRRLDGGGYRPITSVMESPVLREALLEQALADLRRYRQKYNHLRELAPLFVVMDEIEKEEVAA